MAMWGFPLDGPDLRHLIKSYLDGMGKMIKTFGTNNLPGKTFSTAFCAAIRICPAAKRT
jgi:hypothetical protein